MDLAGLVLPRYYNASKIKHYEYFQDQVSTHAKQLADEEVDINLQDIFEEPIVGFVEVMDEYDNLWAAILDETSNSVSSASMMTTQEGWSYDIKERDQSVMEQQEHEEKE